MPQICFLLLLCLRYLIVVLLVFDVGVVVVHILRTWVACTATLFYLLRAIFTYQEKQQA
jgi:hypothetical protein